MKQTLEGVVVAGISVSAVVFVVVAVLFFFGPLDGWVETIACSSDEHLVTEKKEIYGDERRTERLRCCARRADRRAWGKCFWMVPVSGEELLMLALSAAAGWLSGIGPAVAVLLWRRKRARALR